MPDYKRFHIFQNSPSEFSLMDEQGGKVWVWKGISSKTIVHKMMEFLQDKEFGDEEYRRVRKLSGAEWEREFTEG